MINNCTESMVARVVSEVSKPEGLDAMAHLDLKHAADVAMKGRAPGREKKWPVGKKNFDSRTCPSCTHWCYNAWPARAKGYVDMAENNCRD